jgi:hypothetical protein
MPWYYVGPDAKPVGPLSLEELQSRRLSGALSPETYVVETGTPTAPKEWRHYREFFPAAAVLPPLPPLPAPPVPHAPPVLPHPLFPSAVPSSSPHSPGGPVFTGTHPSVYNHPPHALGRTNAWCAWGFGLGLAGLPFLVCGVGVFMAIAGLIVSIIGLVELRKHRDQQGRGLAIAGISCSLLTLLIVGAMGVAWAVSSLRTSVQMTTEQTTNDTDTR